MFKPLISGQPYRLNEFAYTFKLNQRVRAASLIINTYKLPKNTPDNLKLEPIVKEKELFENKVCYPPILAVRKWRVFIMDTRKYRGKYGYCEPQKIFIIIV